MRPLDRWSESYPASGSMAGEGVLKQLGAPKLEKLELLTREVLQNCWDAAVPDDPDGVWVRIACDELSGGEIDALTRIVFCDLPADIDLVGSLRSCPRVMRISDRGTRGLGGPTRADVATDGPTDFVDFVRNVGQPPDTEFGGGSFGYGKGALYLSSLAHSIIVYSRAENVDGDLETRLIAAGLGNHGTEVTGGSERRLTGRHWWGRISADNEVADPVTGDDADQIISLLGMRVFAEDETGTDIVIIAPDLRVGSDPDAAADPARALQLMARSIAWHFWPKLRGDNPAMEIELLLDGEAVPIPDGETEPRIAAFEAALARLDGVEHDQQPFRGEVSDIDCQRPARHVGRMAVEIHDIPGGVGVPEIPIMAPEGPGPLCHIALMRKAELVVKYLKGPELPAAGVGYAGVFRCEEDLDGVFRSSEPPSHDDWVPQALPKGPERTFVNIVPKRIQERISAFIEAFAPAPPGGGDVPLGEFARHLAGLIPAIRGTGPSPAEAGTGRGSARRLLTVTRQARPESGGLVTASVRAHDRIRVRALPAVVVTDGAVERERPEGAAVPEVHGWTGPNGGEHSGDEVAMEKGEEWTVKIAASADVMVKVDFEASA